MASSALNGTSGMYGGMDAVVPQSASTNAYSEVRQGFETWMKAQEDLGLLSNQEIQSQRSYIQSIADDPKKIQQVKEDYLSADASRRHSQNVEMVRTKFYKPLKEAREKGEISETSYEEWVAWLHARDIDAPVKQKSIKGEGGYGGEDLKSYLSKRKELAKKREDLKKDSRIKDRDKIQDQKLKGMVDALFDDSLYFNTLSFSQRKNLIDSITASLSVLKGGDLYKAMKDDAEKLLNEATKEPHPALHRDKVGTWLKRIFTDGVEKMKRNGASPEAIQKEMERFVKGAGSDSLSGLINTWRAVAVQFWTLREDAAFDGVKPDFINTKAFLWLNYKDRVNYVAKMKADAAKARALRSQATSMIAGSEHALSAGGHDRWLKQYVFNGNHTLAELESIIAGNMKTRLNEKVSIFSRFQKASKKAEEKKGLRGMKVLGREEFLKKKYPEQKTFVVEMELRLDQQEKGSPDFLTIRHFMDRGDWNDAADLIKEERKKDYLSEYDKKQLDSMQSYIAEHQKSQGKEVEALEEQEGEAAQIDQLIDEMPPEMQDFMAVLTSFGGHAVRMFGWGCYNREWCNKNGYLTPEREQMAVRKGKVQAKEKQRGNRRGVYNETIGGDTGEEEFIELSRTAPTNICLDITDTGAKAAMLRTVYTQQSDPRKWYWSNVIFHRSGQLMTEKNQREETKKIYRIGRLQRSLEAKGQDYKYKGTSKAKAHSLGQMTNFKKQ